MYTGVTNDLKRRLDEHEQGSLKKNSSFTSRYNVLYLLYFEHHSDILHAIAREKEIKGWVRVKKESIITDFNPEWNFLNDEI